MLKFINKLTGSYMYVDESRKEEYLKAGHKLAFTSEEKPKTTRKRTTKKKVEN